MPTEIIATDTLLQHLRASYPSMQWDAIPRQRDDHSIYTVIVFTAEGTSIEDPTTSTCSRFTREDRYGLAEDDALKLHRHNRAAANPKLATCDLEAVYAALVDAAEKPPDLKTKLIVSQFGLFEFHTGGGCMAYALFDIDDHHILVTDDNCALPDVMGEAMIGLYDGDQQELALHVPPESWLYRSIIYPNGLHFESYAASRGEAERLLIKALEQHAIHHRLAPDWYRDEKIHTYVVSAGRVYQGHQAIAIEEDPQPVPLYRREFPSFGELDVTLPAGFEDSSWHNDVCPSWSKQLDNGNYLRLWVDYTAIEDREYKEGGRFCLQLHSPDFEFTQDLMQSDSLDEVTQFIASYQPGLTPYVFLRNAYLMNREQLNGWSVRHVGNAPDSEGEVEINQLRLHVAEMMFYHHEGESLELAQAGQDGSGGDQSNAGDDLALQERTWQQSHAEYLLTLIQEDPAFKQIHSRVFAIGMSSEGKALEVDISYFAEPAACSDADKLALARMKAGQSILSAQPAPLGQSPASDNCSRFITR